MSNNKKEYNNMTMTEKLLSGMEELSDALETACDTNSKVSEKFTMRSVILDLSPSKYDADMVKEVREIFGVSQAVFAQYLGVSLKTLQSWEQGKNRINGAVCRLMDEIKNDPDYFVKRLKALTKETVAS